jgi:hypothetical protein
MNWKEQIVRRLRGQDSGCRLLYLPDLSLWYEWHMEQGTLPPDWRGASLPAICRAMDVPIWLPFQPWQLETPGVETVTTEEQGERTIRWRTEAGSLASRWTLGPDGDWWQVEYPIKGAQDLPAALEWVQARSYVLDEEGLAEARAEVGSDGVVALVLPRRPYSDLLHEILGWAEGLLLLNEPAVQEMLADLEDKLQALAAEVAQLPGDVVLSPDNLDGQYISPRMYERHLAASYQQTAEQLAAQGKCLVVHAGGPVRRLLGPLAEAGVAAVEGIAGPPQSDASLAEAREAAGPGLTLWGGIAQDLLLEAHDWPAFEAAVNEATEEAKAGPRAILGVADRVPVLAELDRLRALAEWVAKA